MFGSTHQPIYFVQLMLIINLTLLAGYANLKFENYEKFYFFEIHM